MLPLIFIVLIYHFSVRALTVQLLLEETLDKILDANATKFNLCGNNCIKQFENAIKQVNAGTEKEISLKWKNMCERGAILNFIRLLEYFSEQNLKGNHSNNSLITSSCCLTLWLIQESTKFEFCVRKVVESGLGKKLTAFIFTPVLFSDLRVSSDLLLLGVRGLNRIVYAVHADDITTNLTERFGLNWIEIEQRFKVERSPIPKLMVAKLLLNKNKILNTGSYNTELYIEKSELWELRDRFLCRRTVTFHPAVFFLSLQCNVM